MKTTQSSINNIPRTIAKWVAIIIFAGTVYIGNRSVQSQFGAEARANIEFEMLDLDTAVKHAKTTDKLVLADMSAEFCPSCRKLDEQIFANDQIKHMIEKDFIFARIDYASDKGQAFMRKYNVSGFPILLVLDEKGERLTRLPLTFSVEEFADNLKKVTTTYL